MSFESNPILLFLFSSCIIAIGAPRLWVCAFISLTLPPFIAITISIASSILGSYISFFFFRFLAKKEFSIKLQKLIENKKISIPIGKIGICETVLIRQIPVHGLLTTFILSISNASTISFIVGSIIGFIPSTITVALSSSLIGGNIPASLPFYSSVIIIFLCVICLVVKRKVRKNVPSPIEHQN